MTSGGMGLQARAASLLFVFRHLGWWASRWRGLVARTRKSMRNRVFGKSNFEATYSAPRSVLAGSEGRRREFDLVWISGLAPPGELALSIAPVDNDR